MGYSTPTPLDELGLKAGCLPFRAIEPNCPLFGLGLHSVEHNIDAMRQRLKGDPFLETQNPCGLELAHDLDVDSLSELTTEYGIPIPFDHEVRDVIAAARKPTLRVWAQQWLQKLLPNLCSFKPPLSGNPNVKLRGAALLRRPARTTGYVS